MIDLGLRQPRIEGEEYLSVVDEFMEAVHARWPKAIVQVCLFVYLTFSLFSSDLKVFIYFFFDKKFVSILSLEFLSIL